MCRNALNQGAGNNALIFIILVFGIFIHDKTNINKCRQKNYAAKTAVLSAKTGELKIWRILMTVNITKVFLLT